MYNFRCYFCHGYSGNSQTLAASFLNPVPQDFTDLKYRKTSREHMLLVVRDGLEGTAMKPFAKVLSDYEREQVIDYIRYTFMESGQEVPGYHTDANGWPEHERYKDAFPFATGEIPLDVDQQQLTEQQKSGFLLYNESCVSCHDRSRVEEDQVFWKPSALSYPRPDFKPGDSLIAPDAITGPTTFSTHDIVPVIENLSEIEKQGERLFQSNCAFCHAADGTGKNWIGTFLVPPARDLTDAAVMSRINAVQLKNTIKKGIPNTSMPAWEHVLIDAEIDGIVAYIHRAIHPLSGVGD